MYSSIELDNSARNLAIHYWLMMSLCWSWTTFSCGFLVLFYLFLVSTKQETLSAALVTHVVQWAVSVGEVKSFQAVGLTQEVVEMLKVKNSTKLALYPWCSFSGGVKYSLLYMVKGNILSLLQMYLNLNLLCCSFLSSDHERRLQLSGENL